MGAAPSVDGDAPLESYLANEQAAQQATETSALEYYKQLLQQAHSALQSTQEQAQAAAQQAAELQQAQESHEQQVLETQQAALQQVQSANASATQAMQHAVDAENRALLAKGTETASKIQQQQLRSHLFDLASAGVPGSEPPTTDLNQQGQPAGAEGMPGQDVGAEDQAALGPGAAQPPSDSSGAQGAGSSAGPQLPSDGSAQAPQQDPTAAPTGVLAKAASEAVAKTIRERLQKIQQGKVAAAEPPFGVR